MGGGLLLYIKGDTQINFWNMILELPYLSVEINLRKRKSFFNDYYNLHKNKISNHLNYLNFLFSKYSKVYDNFISMGNFNVTMSDKVIKDFCTLNILKV